MKNVLFVNACVRQNSRTKILANYLISKLNCNIKEINLKQEKILPLSEKDLAFRDMFILKQNCISPVFDYARLFADTDEIILATPFWDFSFPASLKCFIEKSFTIIYINGNLSLFYLQYFY